MKLVAQTARRTNVLYVAPDGREAKLARGAFDKSHPHLTLEFTTDVHEARRHLKENGGMRRAAHRLERAPRADALALIAHVRQQSLPMAVIAAGEQALERYAQAGADECVARGASFLARLPDAIDGAVAKRQAAAARRRGAGRRPAGRCGSPMPATSSSSRVRSARIARSCTSTPLAQVVADAAAGTRRRSTPWCSITAPATPTPPDALADVKRLGSRRARGAAGRSAGRNDRAADLRGQRGRMPGEDAGLDRIACRCG